MKWLTQITVINGYKQSWEIGGEIHNEESNCQDRNLMINVHVTTSETVRHFPKMMQHTVDDISNKQTLPKELLGV
jgi:hypothetical protein